ncbi:hypothetical protein MRX96_054573 [Rhipicephalus microplus]
MLPQDLVWMNDTPMGCAWLIWTFSEMGACCLVVGLSVTSGGRVWDRDLLSRCLAERDPDRRVWDEDLLSRRCCWLLLFPNGGKDA